MFVVMGATGHVGSAVADVLLAQGEAVTIVTRHPDAADAWRGRGAQILAGDAEDPESLRKAFGRGTRAFLLNPPGDPTGDSDAAELRTITNILAAIEGLPLEKVVAASTYGAHPGDAVGDFTTLWTLEEGLQRGAVPAAINRGAYYMSNWLAFTDQVRETRKLPSMFPADTSMPMVAPQDLGRAAVTRLLSGPDDVGVRYVEGPSRYTPQDVADAFAQALGRPAEVEVTPRAEWERAYRAIGFSDASALSYTRMTAESLDSGFDTPDAPDRGSTTLGAFITAAVR